MKNQCDGCVAKMPTEPCMGNYVYHINPKPSTPYNRIHMICCKDDYCTTQTEKVAKDEL